MNCTNFTEYNLPKPKHLHSEEKGSSNNSLVTLEAFKGSASFTAESAKFLADPRYSLLIQGISLVCSKPSGGYMSGLEQMMGGLMIMASPAWAVIRIGLGLPLTLVGAAATAITGGAVAAEWGGRKVVKGALQAVEPSEKEKLREKLTENFVKRMHLTMAEMDYNEKVFFKDHPEQLISLAAIYVAFLSRNEEENSIKSAEKVIKIDDLPKEDENSLKYFKQLCEMKNAIKSLNFGRDSTHSWNLLLDSLKNIDEPLEEGASRHSINEKETLKLLVEMACTLGDAVNEDELFKKIWEESIA